MGDDSQVVQIALGNFLTFCHTLHHTHTCTHTNIHTGFKVAYCFVLMPIVVHLSLCLYIKKQVISLLKFRFFMWKMEINITTSLGCLKTTEQEPSVVTDMRAPRTEHCAGSPVSSTNGRPDAYWPPRLVSRVKSEGGKIPRFTNYLKVAW